MDIRRLATRGLLAAPLVAGAGAALLLWLPNVARDAIRSRVRAATGLELQVEETTLGWSEVALRGISLHDEGVAVEVSELRVQANPLLLALRGRAAVQGIEVDTTRVTVTVDAPATQRLLERVRSARAKRAAAETGEASASPSALSHAQVGPLALELRDAHGVLLRVQGARAALQDGALDVTAPTLTLGHPEAPALELSELRARGRRDSGGLRVERAEAARCVARVGDESARDQSPAMLARIRDALGVLTANAAHAAAPAATTGTATVNASANVNVNAGPSAAWRMLANATLELRDGSVLRNSAPLLAGLHASVRVGTDASLRLAGTGDAQGGGAVSWDLALWPQTLRAEGKVELRALPLSLLAPLLPEVPWQAPEQARVEASLVLTAESQERIAIEGEAHVQDVVIAAPRLASAPVRIASLAMSGKGHFFPLRRRLELDEGEVVSGKARVQLHGGFEWARPDYLFDFVATLPSTKCTDAIRAIPNDLLGELALASWQGALGGSITLKVDSRALTDSVLDVKVDDRCEFLTVPALADLRRFQEPFVHQVLEPDGSVFEMETGPGTPSWTYLEDISPFFVHAVLAHEDAGFFAHRGFSPLHIRNALVRNLQEGRYVVGASTITMQLVKNVFLHREKTLARKLQEVLLTWWIERVMSKSDILELYLNVIEYGPSVYGIRHAAQHYFGRLPAQLSPAEAVHLANILPNPKRYHSQYESNQLSAQWIEKLRKMMLRMRERGWYSPEAAGFGLEELQQFKFVPEGSIPLPRTVPGGSAPLPYMAPSSHPQLDDVPTSQLDDDAAGDAWREELEWERRAEHAAPPL